MARDRYKVVVRDQPHFVTCTVVSWIPIFARPEAVEKVLDSLRFLQKHEHLILYAFVIMENHVHLIASAEDLPNNLQRFKSFTARGIIDLLTERRERHILEQLGRAKLPHKQDRDHQLWQEGVHAILIQDEAMMRQKVEYMHANPVRRGYVDDPTHWRNSSARNYAGQAGLLEVSLAWGKGIRFT